jgi:hypothetical protein
MIGLISLVALAACGTSTSDTESTPQTAGEMANEADTNPPAAAKVTMGNGDANWIIAEDVSRDQATLTFSEVRIDGNGWLVLHPFKDGKPVGEIYVGHTYIEDGDNQNVEITLDAEPAAGDMFIVMLHRDVNENQEFDFIFVDDVNVVDRAVFEGTTMIAHPIAAP